MPTITAYIGVSHFCALLYKSKNDYDYVYSPYVYLPEVFCNYTSEEAFYTSILELFCKKNGLTFSECDVYISGFLNTPDFRATNVKKIEFTKLFDNMPNYYPVIVNDFAFATKFFMVSSSSFGFMQNGSEDESFKLNKCIYPHLKAADLSSQLGLDKEVLEGVVQDNIKWDSNTPIIFMDSRFYGEDDQPLDYIYMFSLISTPGIYDLYVDRTQTLLLFNMLNMVLKEDKIPLDLDNIEHIGTLVTSSGPMECLISSEEVSPFVFEVEKNSLKRNPLVEDTEYRLVIKNKNLGTIEKNIFGGKLGLIVDTRDKKLDAFSNIRKFDTYLKFLKD